MASLTRFEGELEVDHSASPGLTPAEARACGYFTHLNLGEGQIFRAATITCAHCKIPFLKNPLRTRPREYCKKCDHYICDFCGFERTQASYSHLQFEQKAELILNAAEHETMGSPLALVAPISIINPL
jgi:hypothetical protein